MRTAAALTGLEPYLDPWHGLESTSRRVIELLRSWGWSVQRQPTPRAAVDARPDLIVVNLAGRGGVADLDLAEHDRAWQDAIELAIPVLALHSSAIAFASSQHWRELIGGGWIPGRSGHPQIGWSVIHVSRNHAITRGGEPFVVYDERYSYLEMTTGQALASHVEDGVRHDLAWAVEDTNHGRRAVFDGLGHAVESYDSLARVELLRREVEWLVGDEGVVDAAT